MIFFPFLSFLLSPFLLHFLLSQMWKAETYVKTLKHPQTCNCMLWLWSRSTGFLQFCFSGTGNTANTLWACRMGSHYMLDSRTEMDTWAVALCSGLLGSWRQLEVLLWSGHLASSCPGQMCSLVGVRLILHNPPPETWMSAVGRDYSGQSKALGQSLPPFTQ